MLGRLKTQGKIVFARDLHCAFKFHGNRTLFRNKKLFAFDTGPLPAADHLHAMFEENVQPCSATQPSSRMLVTSNISKT